jgi:6,7-dimethyl-8-ribityllumazine synthase
MGNVIQGKLTVSKSTRFAIVVSRFNSFITQRLLDGAMDALVRHGADAGAIDVVWTPGAWEIPLVVRKITEGKKHDAVICLGAVIRGDTPHFDYIAAEAARGVASAAACSGRPVVFGILTTDTLDQAVERAGAKSGNKGAEAAVTAIEMVNLMEQL